jgi:hypothetical protein
VHGMRAVSRDVALALLRECLTSVTKDGLRDAVAMMAPPDSSAGPVRAASSTVEGRFMLTTTTYALQIVLTRWSTPG